MPGSNDFKSYSIAVTLLIIMLSAACSNSNIAPHPATLTAFPASSSTPVTPTVAQSSAVQITETPAPTATTTNVTSFPDPGGFTWSEVVSGLNKPIGLNSANDSSGRLFIIEQRGRILIHDGQKLLDIPFLDIQDRVGDRASEQGLLGLAFHPQYQANGLFFVNYTDTGGNTVVSRFPVSSDPDQADSGSETMVLAYDQPFNNHNGGQLAFGPGGYLWIATGDGGGSGDPNGNAQKLDTLLGKLLRIDVNQQPYQIPDDNPFGNEIWSYGLRNPWRFTFDPSNGDLYIADVGQNKWEEINYLPEGQSSGANFGWDYREGSHPFEGSAPETQSLIDPVYEYDHSLGCSISGGAVYRGSLPEWQGVYFYGDLCSGTIWGLLQSSTGQWQNDMLFRTDHRIAAIDQDESGEVYLVDIQGVVLKLSRQ